MISSTTREQEIAEDVEIILDISRLISRGMHPMPTGVDRVEMAYAQTLAKRLGEKLQFAAVNPMGVYGRIGHQRAMHFLNAVQDRWTGGKRKKSWRGISAILTILRLWPEPWQRHANQRRFLVQASPNHLDNVGKVRSKLSREAAKFVCVVFDLIPIEFPEYGRSDGAAKHLARVRTMATLADGLITISAAVARSMQPFLKDSGRDVAIRPALLGVDLPSADIHHAYEAPQKPYFVFVSTIEPRKNHLLLLHAWRRMIETLGPERTPHLIIIGRRGWENENIIDMLERCETTRGHVTELQGLSDKILFPLILGARAMLFPSFAEGFGMPVAEALALGTPVICSDIPALREAGQEIPDYLDPLDGPAWIDAILDYANEDSAARAAQIERMKAWRTPTWDDHIDSVLRLIADIDRGSAN